MPDEIAGAGTGAGGAAAIADPPSAADVAPSGDAGAALEEIIGTGGDGAGGDDGAAPAGAPTAEKEKADADAAAAAKAKEPAAAKEEVDDEEITSADGRKITNANLRKGIAELRKSNPEAAKAVGDAYFSFDAIKNAAAPEAKNNREVINAVKGMKATLDSVGGETGLQEIHTELTDWRNEGKQFGEGDPALVAAMGEANPDALMMSSQNSLDWLREHKPDLFDKAILPAMVGRLEEVGFGRTLDAIDSLLRQGKGQEAFDILQKLKGWAKTVGDRAGEFNKDKETRRQRHPEQDQIEQDRQALAKEKNEFYESTVNSNLTTLNNPVLDEQTKEMFKELGLNNAGRRDFINNLMSRVWSTMSKDKVYQRQARAVLAKGDAKESADFIHAKFAELLPDHFIEYRNIRYPSLGKVAAKPRIVPPATNGKPAAGAKPGVTAPPAAATGRGTVDNPIMLRDGDMPTQKQVDWKKTTEVQYISGRAVLTNGKAVRWRVNHH